MTVLIFFDTIGELSDLTELNHEELWDNGFNLDDFDYGFVTNKPFGEIIGEYGCHLPDEKEAPIFMKDIFQMMENHCVGYSCTHYKDKYYFMVYHS